MLVSLRATWPDVLGRLFVRTGATCRSQPGVDLGTVAASATLGSVGSAQLHLPGTRICREQCVGRIGVQLGAVVRLGTRIELSSPVAPGLPSRCSHAKRSGGASSGMRWW